MQARRTNFYRGKNGVTRIRRDTYATKGGFTVTNSWWELRKMAVERSGGKCDERGCYGKAEEVHHIVPLSRGGRNVLSNLMCLCKDHHDKKHNHLFRAR